MTAELLQLIHQRKALYRRVRASKFQDIQLLQQFKRLRCQTNNFYRYLRNGYFYAACQNYHSKPRLLWSVISSVTGRRQPRREGSVSPSDLNSHFCNIVTDDAVSYTLPCGPPSAGDLCAFAEVTIESVCSMLSRLNPLKAPGLDGILPFLLKSFAPVLTPSLTLIFNRSLHSGVAPSGFKKANIAAVPKNIKGIC